MRPALARIYIKSILRREASGNQAEEPKPMVHVIDPALHEH